MWPPPTNSIVRGVKLFCSSVVCHMQWLLLLRWNYGGWLFKVKALDVGRLRPATWYSVCLQNLTTRKHRHQLFLFIAREWTMKNFALWPLNLCLNATAYLCVYTVHQVTLTDDTLYNNVNLHRLLCLQGIRYAAPPVGERRWKKPEALTGSECDANDDVDATQFGNKCLQWNWDGRSIIGALRHTTECQSSASTTYI